MAKSKADSGASIMDEWKDATPAPSESTEQQCLFEWARMAERAHPELRLMYHIPNEGKRSGKNGARLVAEGLKKGVPDICLPVARGGCHGLYIELKRIRNSKVTREQVEWIEALKNQGYMAAVCRGWGEASETILEYLRGSGGRADAVDGEWLQ